MTRTRTLWFLSHVALAFCSAALTLSGCAPAQLDAVTSEEELLATTATVQGSSLRSLGFEMASLDAHSKQPVYLAGRVPAAIRTHGEARDFVMNLLSRSLRLAPESDFMFQKEMQGGDGYRYLRLRQTHGGIPVEQGELTLQIADDGAVYSVIGRPLPALRIPTRPTLTGDVAMQSALGKLVHVGKSTVHESPHLIIHTNASSQPLLTYHSVVEYQGEHGLAFEDLYVDAHSGRVVSQIPRIHTGLTRSIYDGKNACFSSGSELPGTLLYNEGSTSADPTANAAYNNTGTAYWFYKNFLGRDSYNNAGALLKSSVHFQFWNGLLCDGNNAAWIGSPYNQMVYGDGDATTFKPLALALDVTAHELTHAVTDLTSNLLYSNESGALNEAMSDIFGAVAEAWKASGGSQAGNPPGVTATANTWKIGEELAQAGFPGGALRFMNNPTADAYSQDYYPERITSASDHGGVHGNSGIANLAFYLLSQGGSHPRGKTTTSVTGIGIEKAAKIFFKANTTLMNSSTNFQDARNATAQAARTLYGACSPVWTNTERAWDAVGVPGTWTPCDLPPVAIFSASPSSGTGPLNVTFDASSSYDPYGSITSYAWSFGDGAMGSGSSATHTYADDPYVTHLFAASLKVTNNRGVTGSSSTSIQVMCSNHETPPTPKGAVGVDGKCGDPLWAVSFHPMNPYEHGEMTVSPPFIHYSPRSYKVTVTVCYVNPCNNASACTTQEIDSPPPCGGGCFIPPC